MSIRYYTEAAQRHALHLRREMTPQERHLWYDFLRGYRPRFFRQRPIGAYIVDFVCPEAGLIIEADGGQHYEKDALAYDEKRTQTLRSKGYRVLRLTNIDIMQHFDSVCELIDRAVKDNTIAGRINS